MGKTIQSEVTEIRKPAIEIYNFLSDFTNFSHLIPDQVENWQATADQCSFELKSMASLSMRITERLSPSRVVMVAEGKLPFGFSITSSIEELTADSAQVRLILDSDMNAMIAMMAERPLTDFVNLLVARLKSVMETNN